MSSVDVSEIKSHFLEVLEEAEQSIDEAYLFGSQARGEATEESDIDIVLIDSKFENTPMYKRGHWFKREWDYLGVGPLELLCYTPDEYSERLEKNHSTVSDIEDEGISLTDDEEEN